MNAPVSLNIIRSLANERSVFLLSELRALIPGEPSLEHLYLEIAPHLPALGLVAKRAGDDFEISRDSSPGVKVLSEEERAAIDTYLGAPSLPPLLEDLIEEFIGKKTGKRWDDPVILERLRRAIVSQKDQYWREGRSKKISYEKGYSVLGYLVYQLPVYFVQFEHILRMIAGDGLLKTKMRVLDVGTGPGVVPLAFTDFLSRLKGCSAAIHTMEQSTEQIEAFNYLVPGFTKGSNEVFIGRPVHDDIRKFSPGNLPGPFDFIVFQNVLNELPVTGPVERADIVEKFSHLLAEDGSILVIEPADLTNSTVMRKTVLALVDRGFGIFSPCRFIWGARCSPDSCWIFEQKPHIRPTRLMKALAGDEEAYRYLNTDIKYSYAVIRKDGRQRSPYRVPIHAKFARFSQLGRHVGRKVNVIASVMSGDLGDNVHHVYRVCDGTSRNQVFIILPRYYAAPATKAVLEGGDNRVIEFHQVQVRFNPRYHAYNLLVNRSTRIIQITTK
jgi:SAM-dependent methyltransferase